YVAQQWNTVLARHGFHIVELPFQAHPEIPSGGMPVGPRTGEMYSLIEREAAEAGMTLCWPPRLPNTRTALAAAERTRQQRPHAFPGFHKALFEAHFVRGEDLEDPTVIDRHALESRIDLPAMRAALADGSAMLAVTESEMSGRKRGVHGTPAWWLGRRL